MTSPFNVERDDLKYYARWAVHGDGPVSGQVELTTACFQRCGMCESWREDLKGSRHHMSLAQLKQLCTDLARFFPSFSCLTLTGGDPQSWEWLDEFLRWFKEQDFQFVLRMNTALTREPDYELYAAVFEDIHVSLDSIVPKTYAAIRGVDDVDPRVIVDRIERLAMRGMDVTTFTVLDPRNIEEVDEFIKVVGEIPLRKMTFVPVTGERHEADATDPMWIRWRDLVVAYRGHSRCSFGEDIADARRLHRTGDTAKVRCWTGRVTFHMKPNGDIYPCPTVGGESLGTRDEFCTRNYIEQGVTALVPEDEPPMRYLCEDSTCRRLCPWKQTAFNLLAEDAKDTWLAIP